MPKYQGKIDLIYIYPPFNTGSDFSQLVAYKNETINRFDKEDENGKYKITYRNRAEYKTYLKNGKPIESVWSIPIIMKNANEFAGDNFTQKPEALLQSIIKASSDANSIILDFLQEAGRLARWL